MGSSLPSLNWLPLPTNDIPDEFCISVEETEKALLSSKLHTSAGPDEIPSWLLRENASVLCRPLCSIFNASVREGFVPSIWKAADITSEGSKSSTHYLGDKNRFDVSSKGPSSGISVGGRGKHA